MEILVVRIKENALLIVSIRQRKIIQLFGRDATDTPHVGCRSISCTSKVSYTQLPTPWQKKGKLYFVNVNVIVFIEKLALFSVLPVSRHSRLCSAFLLLSVSVSFRRSRRCPAEHHSSSHRCSAITFIATKR